MTDMGADRSRSLGERVAEEIRVVLTRRRMSAAQLARQLGVSQTYIWRRLEGQTAFDLDDLERIAAVLEVDVIDLMRRPAQAGGPLTIPSDLLARSAGSTSPERASRHGEHGPIDRGPRDHTRPTSAVAANRRRPAPVRPVNRPMAA